MKANRAILLALVILLVGAPAWGQVQEPIKIGALLSLSGPAAASGSAAKLVAEMAVDKINQAGGINGRPLQLIIADTECDPDKAAAAAQKFIQADKVAAIIGPARTDIGLHIKKIVETAGIPTIMTVGGDQVILNGDENGSFAYIFKSSPRSTIAVKRLYSYLKEKKITQIALLTAADSFGKDGEAWLENLAQEFGLTIVAKESFDANHTDLTAQLTKLKNANPQAIVCWANGPAAALVSKNLGQIGFKVPIFQCHCLADPQYLELAGQAAAGNRMPAAKLLVADQLPDNDPQKPVIQEFISLYQKRPDADRQSPSAQVGYVWDAIMIVADAMKKAGTDPRALQQAIEQTKGYVGVSGIYNLTPEDHSGLGVDSMIIVQVKDGKFVKAD